MSFDFEIFKELNVLNIKKTFLNDTKTFKCNFNIDDENIKKSKINS